MSDHGEDWEPGRTLVSAIMITADRPLFVPMAIDCFLAQTYAPKELVIVDDGRPCISFAKVRRAVKRAAIRWVYVNRKIPVGAKWNIAVEAALGDHLIFWADDDWHHPDRIRRQLLALQAAGAEACALGDVPYVYLSDGRRYKFTAQPGKVLDGTYLFTRRFAERGPFPRTACAESANWLNNKPSPIVLQDTSLYLGTIHGSNAWGHFPRDQWAPDPAPCPLPQPILDLVGRPEILMPLRELIFEVAGFEGEDAIAASWPVADRAAYAARKILSQPEFQSYDFDGKPLVVVVEGQSFRVMDRTPIIVPWMILPLGKELIDGR